MCKIFLIFELSPIYLKRKLPYVHNLREAPKRGPKSIIKYGPVPYITIILCYQNDDWEFFY